jgi:hypothetical protein
MYLVKGTLESLADGSTKKLIKDLWYCEETKEVVRKIESSEWLMILRIMTEVKSVRSSKLSKWRKLLLVKGDESQSRILVGF